MAEIRRLKEIVQFLTNRLKIYEPNIEEDLRSYSPQVFQPSKKWQSISASLLAKVPPAKEWYQKQCEIGVSDAASYEKIIRLIVKRDVGDVTIRLGQGHLCSEEDDLVNVVEAYAMTTKAISGSAKFATALASFRGLILSSLCAVLEQTKQMPVEMINSIMRRCLESKADIYELKRMRRAAVFINKLICLLADHGWTIHRATELFFLCGQSIHLYGKLMHADCRAFLLDNLTQEQFINHNFEDCFLTEYTIPGFVNALAPNLTPGLLWQILCDRRNAPSNTFRVRDRIRMNTSPAGEFTIQEWSPPSYVPAPLHQRSLEQLVPLDLRLMSLEGFSKVSETISLLLILSFLGGSHIPRLILTRGCTTRRRWDDNGEIKEMSPVRAGLDPDLVAFLSNEPALDQAFEILVSQSLVKVRVASEGYQILTIDPSLQRNMLRELSQIEKDRWNTQAWVLACQAFFRGSTLENVNESAARAQLLHLQHALDYHGFSHYQSLPTGVKVDLAATLLVASVFPPKAWKERAITVAKQIVNDLPKCYLHIWVQRREVQLSSTPKPPDQIENLSHHHNPRLYAQYGRFLISNAEKCLQNNKIAQAKTILHKWIPPDIQHPTLVRSAVIRWRFALAKAVRYEGLFPESLALFQQLSRDTDNLDGFRWVQCRISSHLADLRCELGQPKLARDLLFPRIERYKKLGNDCLAMSLVPSLAEALIQERDLVQAELHLSQALSFYRGLEGPNEVAKLAHVRVCLGLAKIATFREQWDHSLSLWSAVLDLTQAYAWGQGFTCGIVNLSISYVTAKMRSIETSQKALRLAMAIIDQEGWNQYWLAMVPTHWRKYLESTWEVGGGG